MIAQYHRKFGFTAILVSHEIPDVYFISNRVLALYERTIVFQGTPEELEDFDHPFKDEVINSLEELQKELTGLYSKRQFKVLNHLQLKRRTFGETYSVAVFTLENINSIIAHLGHDAVQEAIRRMELFIDKHFGAIGGFSTRRNTNEVITVLPYSDITEAENILKDFAKDFQGLEINDIGTGVHSGMAVAGPVEFTILAGIAQGQPIAEIDSVIASAKSHQKEIWTATIRRQGEKI
jgi:phospholipid/cholesterol/gamma-HCH transport system ATP-binding protein